MMAKRSRSLRLSGAFGRRCAAVVAALLTLAVVVLPAHAGPRAAGLVQCGGVTFAQAPPLPPGVVTLTRFKVPHGPPPGPVTVSMYRVRCAGVASLCVDEHPQNGWCATYPIGPTSRYQQVSNMLWVLNGGHGSCNPPRFQDASAIVLRPGLTAWLRSPHGVTKMASVKLPSAFGVTGPFVYAVLTSAPDTILLRAADGRTEYSTPAFSGGPKGYCGGLNPSTIGN